MGKNFLLGDSDPEEERKLLFWNISNIQNLHSAEVDAKKFPGFESNSFFHKKKHLLFMVISKLCCLICH